MAADPNNSKQTLNQAAQGSKNSQKNAAAQAPLKAKNGKEVNKQKTQAAQQPKSQGVQGFADQREVPCPTCNSQNVVKDRIAGKTYFKIPFLEAESKLGLGGTRTTFIAGSELLSVGLGFNSNKT